METVRSIDIIRGRIRITFESGWQVWLLRSDPAVARLAEGSEISREELLQHLRKIQYNPALSKAVSMLAARACSRKEIETGLRRSRYDDEVIRLVICRLDQQGLLNDRDFAEQWVRSRMRKYGSERIRQELRRKGIDTITAGAALESLSEEEQSENAVSFAMKKISSSGADPDRKKLYRQVTGALLRRGYTWETASEAFHKAMEKTGSAE